MYDRLALCIVLSGCGFQSQAAGDTPGSDAPSGDAPSGDAPGGGSDSGSGSGSGSGGQTDCFQHWFDGGPSLVLSQPQELTTLSSSGDDRDPWISADGLRMYFARNPGSHGGNDIYFASRTTTTQDFSNLTALDNLNTDDEETRASLSSDEKLLIFSGDHNTSDGRRHLFVTTRDPQGFPSPPGGVQHVVTAVNTNNVNDLDPFLTNDGLKLYLAPVADPPAVQQIAVATRTAADQDFMSSTLVAVINSPSGEADPAVSRDDRIIVFSSHRPAGAGHAATNLWYATRQKSKDNFSAPQLIPTVNSDQEDGDPMLSDDGCDLYFSSTRSGGKYHLFHANVVK